MFTLVFMGFASLASIAEEKKSQKSRNASQSEIRSKYKTSHLVDLESSKVIIYPDGTWMPYTADGKIVLRGTSDLGDAINMTFNEGEDGTVTRTWKVVTGGGLIEVFLNRLRFSNVNDRCFPTIGLRNFHKAGVREAVIDLMFFDSDPNYANGIAYTGMSMMFTNLDSAEQAEMQGAPIYINKDSSLCNRLRAYAVISQCTLKNGMDCSGLVKVSPFGPILIIKKSSTKEVMDIVLKRDTGNVFTRE